MGEVEESIQQQREGDQFSADAAEILDTADTLFLVSRHKERGLDVSHRGGNPGFLQRSDERTFRVPDYPGNSLFNTFGNLLLDSSAGVTVMDFNKGRMLQMTGTVTIDWHRDEEPVTGGTDRFWIFRVHHWRILSQLATARWEFLDSSPFNPGIK